MTPKQLPNPPAGGLHILPPWLPALAWLLLGLALAAALLRWYLRRRRKRPAAVPPPPSPTDRTTDGFGAIVNRIEDEFGRRHDFRGGLHALAAATRTRLEALRRINAEEMTATEIEAAIDEQPATTLISDLRTHQFGRAEPGGKVLRKMCSRARKAFDGKNG